MPTYDHTCNNCGHIEFLFSVKEYEELTEPYERTDRGSQQLPCPSCGELTYRDMSYGVATNIVKGGTKYTTAAYRTGSEEEWIRNEIQATKNSINGKHTRFRPYHNYHLTDPEAAGFKKVSEADASKRAEVAKSTMGAATEKVEKARKST